MDEKAYYTESPTKKPAQLNCPHCRTVDSYDLNWLLRKKRDRLPGGADERDRAKFAKALSYVVLVDNYATCNKCRRRFEISGIKTMAFV
jgi:hypothetical protein